MIKKLMFISLSAIISVNLFAMNVKDELYQLAKSNSFAIKALNKTSDKSFEKMSSYITTKLQGISEDNSEEDLYSLEKVNQAIQESDEKISGVCKQIAKSDPSLNDAMNIRKLLTPLLRRLELAQIKKSKFNK